MHINVVRIIVVWIAERAWNTTELWLVYARLFYHFVGSNCKILYRHHSVLSRNFYQQ